MMDMAIWREAVVVPVDWIMGKGREGQGSYKLFSVLSHNDLDVMFLREDTDHRSCFISSYATGNTYEYIAHILEVRIIQL